MRLFAAIVPPRHVLEELDSVVQSAQSGGQSGRGAGRAARAAGSHLDEEKQSGRRSLLDRLGTITGRSPDQPRPTSSSRRSGPSTCTSRSPTSAT